MKKLIKTGTKDYIRGLKNKTKKAHFRAIMTVNTELIKLYWEIGKTISENHKKMCDVDLIKKLSKDLQNEFSRFRGFSIANLLHMKLFYESYQDVEIYCSPFGKLSWCHNLILLYKLEKNEERFWYAEQAIKKGWSRNVLIHQIESNMFVRKSNS